MKFTEIAKKAHETAKAKGWHDTPRTWGELMALVHSELSEALEAYRETGDITKTWRREDGKVEGVGAELADAVIRLADACEAWGLDAAASPYSYDVVGSDFVAHQFGDAIAFLHKLVSDAYLVSVSKKPKKAAREVATCASAIRTYALVRGIPIDDLIAEKMAYNETRPHRHGGKHL